MKDACKLTEQQADQISTYERSIDHHCRTCVNLELQRLSALDMVQTLEQGKKQFLASVLTEAGIDPKNVVSVTVDGDTLRYMLKSEG